MALRILSVFAVMVGFSHDGVPKRTAHLMYNPKSNSLRVLAKEDDITINIIKTDSMRDAKLELVSKDRKRLRIRNVLV